MRHVMPASLKKGRVTLVIPPAYRETAETIDREARRLGKTFSSLIWELVDDRLKEERSFPLPSLQVKGTTFKREDLYDELVERRIG